jgi:hypothetical protein
MTRKDYIQIAAVFRAAYPAPSAEPAELALWTKIRDGIAAVFCDDNPYFDRQRFNNATKKPATLNNPQEAAK